MSTMDAFIAALESYRRIYLAQHLFGMALGLGGVAVTDYISLKLMKSFPLSTREAVIMKSISRVIWFGLVIAIVSGFFLYLPAAERLNESPKFLMKLIVVAVILVNGLVLNLYISPKLSGGSVSHRFRKVAYALGSISGVSWLSAFVLGTMRVSPLPFSQLLGAYVLVLCAAIGVSQLLEGRSTARA